METGILNPKQTTILIANEVICHLPRFPFPPLPARRCRRSTTLCLMPSIFTRARTTSTKNLPKTPYDAEQAFGGGVGGAPDEFGRVHSRPPPTPSKGDRKAKDDKRTRAQSTTDKGRRSAATTSAYSAAGGDASFDGMVLEDGYLPTQIVTSPEDKQQAYGYLSFESHVILGVEEVTKLVEVITEELGARGEHLFLCFPIYSTPLFNGE